MSSASSPIKLMLVDDSAVIRGILTRVIETASDIKIVFTAANGEIALTGMKIHQPDVVLLDIEMPVMDGLTALPKLVELNPAARIIMCSTLTSKNANVSMQALSSGAADYILKPSAASEINAADAFKDDLLDKIRTLANSRHMGMSPPQSPMVAAAPKRAYIAPPAAKSTPNAASTSVAKSSSPVTPSPARHAPSAPVAPRPAAARPTPVEVGRAQANKSVPKIDGKFSLKKDKVYTGVPEIIAIGSSTGGPQALFKVLTPLSGGKLTKPLVITQHMPATFTTILAQHIERQTNIPTFEAADGQKIEAGKIYVAPGGKHMLIARKGVELVAKLDDGPPENFCKPAVDPMLRSLCDLFGQKVLTLILTGMGYDGLEGCKPLVEKGARLIAQDQETSVVWGMPGAVASAGLCNEVLPVDDIGPYILRVLSGTAR